MASFARLGVSMAIFSAVMPRPRPSGRWELSVTVESQGGDEKAVRRGGDPNRISISACHVAAPRAGPFGEVDDDLR